MSDGTQDGSTIIPALRYGDAPAAIAWLEQVLGLSAQAVYPDDDGGIAHAQLTLGRGMVMLGTARDTAFGRLNQLPSEAGGRVTQSTYLVVEDADAVHDRAVAAGAEIVIPLTDEDYGGRDFTCRDPEGHLWTVGTYDPW